MHDVLQEQHDVNYAGKRLWNSAVAGVVRMCGRAEVELASVQEEQHRICSVSETAHACDVVQTQYNALSHAGEAAHIQ
jgi:hypothetical protein